MAEFPIFGEISPSLSFCSECISGMPCFAVFALDNAAIASAAPLLMMHVLLSFLR